MQLLNGDRSRVDWEVAAGLMEVSERHSWRLLAAYMKEVATAISSRKQGQGVGGRPIRRPQRHPPYRDTLEREGIELSRFGARRMLLACGMRSPRCRCALRSYSRRGRYPQVEMLLQLDSSRHD